MAYEVDQSGKIEETSRPTILAFSNNSDNYIYITSADKKHFQRKYRNLGIPRIFVYQLFSILLYLLLSKNNIRGMVWVDTEYPGKDSVIKRYICKISDVLRIKPMPVDIHFGFIGKQSKAHKLAISVFRYGSTEKKIHKVERKEVENLINFLNNK